MAEVYRESVAINKSLERLSEHELHPDLRSKCLKVLMATHLYETPSIAVSDSEDEVIMTWGWVPDATKVILNLFTQDYWDRLTSSTYTEESVSSTETERPTIYHIVSAVADIWK